MRAHRISKLPDNLQPGTLVIQLDKSSRPVLFQCHKQPVVSQTNINNFLVRCTLDASWFLLKVRSELKGFDLSALKPGNTRVLVFA